MTAKERFIQLRKAVFKNIAEQLEQEDVYGKSYDGIFEVIFDFHSFYEDKEAECFPECVSIKLHCYLIGPLRHYEWRARTFEEALDKAESEIMSWIE